MKKYLDEVLPDKDKQRIFAEYCGYIFIKPSVLKLEKMLILYGHLRGIKRESVNKNSKVLHYIRRVVFYRRYALC